MMLDIEFMREILSHIVITLSIVIMAMLVGGFFVYSKAQKIYQNDLNFKQQDMNFKLKLAERMNNLERKQDETNTLLQTSVLNNINLSSELSNIIDNVLMDENLDTDRGRFLLNYFKNKVHDTVNSVKLAKNDITVIFNPTFQNMYLNFNELKAHFNPEISDTICTHIHAINQRFYKRFLDDMTAYITQYRDNNTVLYELMKKSTLRYFEADCRSCYNVFAMNFSYNLKNESDIQEEKTETSHIVINNLNQAPMNFNAHTQDFRNSTFNDYKDQVVNQLISENNYSEIDRAVISTIEGSHVHTETEKKELIQAVSEVKKDQNEETKKPFAQKLSKFITANKAILTAILKVGVSAIFTYFGMKGIELIDLE